MKQIVVID